ncbi:GNAT family N-acetyltransferase [Clostridium senegalense]|uniref:GNAT family N-acetyltransferase n=1 Tax=Clostridium senegalense TaxID=1465809 RepID=A0A6M0GZU2_9CLOT|nr:GNAT family N-acetyltransferase [Clostridium senegalense]NEU04050.1 GNAT family N-acetyltransferase [Clostridium senegalense]
MTAKIKKFNELSRDLKENLYNLILQCDKNYTKTFNEMTDFFESEVFQFGTQILTIVDDENIVAVIGVITKEIKICGVGYITETYFNFELIKKYEKQFKILLNEAINICKKVKATEILLGIRSEMFEIKEFFIKHGFIKKYDAIVMRYNFIKKHKHFNDSNITLEKLEVKTLDIFVELYNKAFKDTINAATITKEDAREFLEIYRENEKLLGLIYEKNFPIGIYMLAEVDNVGWIDNIGVLEEHRGRGIGRQVLYKCIDGFIDKNILTMRLLVISSNNVAFELYKNIGFEEEYIFSKWYVKNMKF